MKVLTTALILVIIALVSYPTISKSYNEAIEFKSALKEAAKQSCTNDKDLKWVKLAGSTEVLKCSEL